MINDLRIKKEVVFNKTGFTLVELLIVMAILALLIGIVIGGLNPIALVNKANDSRRKSDLNKIKIAFEAYFNNKGEYPVDVSWNVSSNCGRPIAQMSSYLRNLPCGPNKKNYEILIINSSSTYMVLTNLDNKNDKNIPDGWYDVGKYPSYSAERKTQVNYGVSSSNILWYEQDYETDCGLDCLKCLGLDRSGCEYIDGNGDSGVCISGPGVQCFTGVVSKEGCARSYCCISGAVGCPNP